MKPLRVLAFGAALVLAACTSSPTDTPVDPAGPSFDGGSSLGSGNYAGDDGGGFGTGNLFNEPGGSGVAGSGNEATSDTTGRGINTLGSGN